MKLHLCSLALIVAAAISLPAKAHECFWINNFTISPTLSNPLTGSGFGDFEGSFSSVNWTGTNLGTVSGTFSITAGWRDIDPIGSPGIPWSVDNTLDALVFDTDVGDILTFGTPTFNFTSMPAGYEVCETKALLCTIVSSGLEAEIKEKSDLGRTLYYGFGGKSEFYSFTFDGKSNIIELDANVRSTDELSFFYSDDGGTTKTELTTGIEFDTGVKIGACLCPVPEPSTSFSLMIAGLAFLVRRRRYSISRL